MYTESEWLNGLLLKQLGYWNVDELVKVLDLVNRYSLYIFPFLFLFLLFLLILFLLLQFHAFICFTFLEDCLSGDIEYLVCCPMNFWLSDLKRKLCEKLSTRFVKFKFLHQ